MVDRSRTWGVRHYVALMLALVVVVLGQVGCTKSTGPTAVPSPAAPTAGCNVNGSNNTVNCGNGDLLVTAPAPSPSGSPGGGDNVVESFAIFCYGFGAQPGQAEPNHDACLLPVGYPNIAVTASPKNKAGTDIPNPGDKTDEKVINWMLSVTPANAAELKIQADNRFNATVVPASTRVHGTVFTLVATYKDPQGNVRVATKTGGFE
jgi:hypothetical protein